MALGALIFHAVLCALSLAVAQGGLLPPGKWVLLFRQKDASLPGGGLWPGKTITRLNADNPDAGLYARLDELVR